MKSILVKIASIAVMFHMTFGCSLHHGLGMNACAHQPSTTCDHEHDSHHPDADHEHSKHQHPDQRQPVSDSTCDNDGTGQPPCHLDCCDDGCNALQFEKYEFESIDFSVPYFGAANTMASIDGPSCAGLSTDPFPDYRHTKASLRAHLLFGVLTL